jgi:fructosamine-3-kinase
VGEGIPSDLAPALAAALQCPVDPAPARRVHGGCINPCYRWDTAQGPVFVKVAPTDAATDAATADAAADIAARFEAEAAGLEELARAGALRVPRVLAVGRGGGPTFLALEWIELAPLHRASAVELGRRLARQHRVIADEFGWHRDNHVGATPQSNRGGRDWTGFFCNQRLRAQFELARANGHDGRLQERGATLLERAAEFFVDHRPAASLLHGDLWSGNVGEDERGTPVMFDPAVYYGDREADLAMTHLFGGFDTGFYSAYEAEWPLAGGAAQRVDLYNLYHVLNHLNLFGGAYRHQAEALIDRLLSQT